VLDGGFQGVLRVPDFHRLSCSCGCRAGSGVGVGMGTIFGNYLSAAIRNPSAAQKQFPTLLLGFALTEAIGLFALVIALLILFAF
jgi:F-type H+-transporting ATPase subunit c